MRAAPVELMREIMDALSHYTVSQCTGFEHIFCVEMDVEDFYHDIMIHLDQVENIGWKLISNSGNSSSWNFRFN